MEKIIIPIILANIEITIIETIIFEKIWCISSAFLHCLATGVGGGVCVCVWACVCYNKAREILGTAAY